MILYFDADIHLTKIHRSINLAPGQIRRIQQVRLGEGGIQINPINLVL